MPDTDKIGKLIEDLPEFMRPTAQSYSEIIQRLPQREFFALIDIINDGPIDQAAKELAELSSIHDLVQQKEQLTMITQRLADDRAFAREATRELVRASLQAAVRAAIAS